MYNASDGFFFFPSDPSFLTLFFWISLFNPPISILSSNLSFFSFWTCPYSLSLFIASFPTCLFIPSRSTLSSYPWYQSLSFHHSLPNRFNLSHQSYPLNPLILSLLISHPILLSFYPSTFLLFPHVLLPRSFSTHMLLHPDVILQTCSPLTCFYTSLPNPFILSRTS